MVSGRCLSGPLEVVRRRGHRRQGRPAARRRDGRAGRPLCRGPGPDRPTARRPGSPWSASTAPTTPREAYWAGQHYFPVTADGTRRDAVFISVQTFDLVEHTVGPERARRARHRPRPLTLDRVAGLADRARAGHRPGRRATRPTSSRPTLPALAERVAASREVARRLVPVAFVPLVGICFFVIFLAVGYGDLRPPAGARPSSRCGDTRPCDAGGSPPGRPLTGHRRRCAGRLPARPRRGRPGRVVAAWAAPTVPS